MGEIQKKLGKRIKGLRRAKEWSQEKLGSMAGIHFTYIGSLERGERNISLENIEKLAKALGVSVRNLFKFDEGTNNKPVDFSDITDLLEGKRPKDLKLARKILKAMFEK